MKTSKLCALAPALLLSIAIYVALPLVAGYLSRKWIIRYKGEAWFKEKFLHVLTPVTIAEGRTVALSATEMEVCASLGLSAEAYAKEKERK